MNKMSNFVGWISKPLSVVFIESSRRSVPAGKVFFRDRWEFGSGICDSEGEGRDGWWWGEKIIIILELETHPEDVLSSYRPLRFFGSLEVVGVRPL